MHIFLKDIGQGDTLSGVYLVKSSQLGTTQRNDPFWNLIISDNSAQIMCKIWSPLATSIKSLPSGSFVSLEATAQTYKDNIQLTIQECRILEEEEIKALDLSLYINSSPRPLPEMKEELEKLIKKNITYKPIKKFIKSVLSDPEIEANFYTAPGAKSVHHAYLSGLFEHSLAVCKICLSLCDLYPQVDRQILFAAALFHDIGKMQELSGVLATEYTSEGKLVGHIILGLTTLQKYLDKAGIDPHLKLHFQHLILSHHGELEYGSPKVPATAEAFILHYADNLDAKIAQCTSLISSELEEGYAWSSWNNLLARQLCKVQPAPSTQSDKNISQNNFHTEAQQCSLL